MSYFLSPVTLSRRAVPHLGLLILLAPCVGCGVDSFDAIFHDRATLVNEVNDQLLFVYDEETAKQYVDRKLPRLLERLKAIDDRLDIWRKQVGSKEMEEVAAISTIMDELEKKKQIDPATLLKAKETWGKFKEKNPSFEKLMLTGISAEMRQERQLKRLENRWNQSLARVSPAERPAFEQANPTLRNLPKDIAEKVTFRKF